MALSIYAFKQNTMRLALIDAINLENIPHELTDIQETLLGIDAALDDKAINNEQKSAKFKKELDALKQKLTQLQNDQLAGVTSTDLTQNFVSIYGIIDGMEDLLEKKGIASDEVNDRLMDYLHNVAGHFFAIAKITQNYHTDKIHVILTELRDKERQFLGLCITFVIIGTIMIIFLLVDLFRRGDLLERASHAERLKNSFFAMMSHEIRTPINGILGTLTLLHDTALDAKQRQLTGVIQNSASGLLGIVNDVLDYSKIEAGKLELEYSNFILMDLLEKTFGMLRPLALDKHLKFTYTVDDNIPIAIHSDAARVKQILINFLSNAIKFTNNGSVTLYVKEETHVIAGARQAMLRFEVVDTGIGISEESKKLLFREFSQVDGSYTRRFEGTGLGLAICQRLTEMMKGQIGVHSEPGKGSTFWCNIPLTPATSPVATHVSAPVTVVSNAASKILLVEDNPTNQMIAEAFLKQGGHIVDVAENGRKAVEAVASKDYDMVFMDIAMPEMDGFAATKAIRAMPGKDKLPIIAMTAHAMASDRTECMAAGMNGYLTKPLSRETLLQQVKEWSKAITAEGAPVQPSKMDDEDINQMDDQEISEMHFNQILEDLGAENLASFSKRFFEDLEVTGNAMIEAEKNEKWNLVKLHAHSLKSSTLSFGLLRLSNLAAKIEHECKTHTRPNPELMRDWSPHVKTAIFALKSRLSSINIV